MARFNTTMVSSVLKRAIDLTIVIPSPTYPDVMMAEREGKKVSHKNEEKYPVLYLFHGYSGNHTSWTSYGRTEMFAEERKIAVVMISGENKAYADKETDHFYEFIEEELPEFIKGMFPVSHRVEDTYIAGLSMGGYGTYIHALGNPEKYCAFGAFSAAVQSKHMSPDAGIRYAPLQLIDEAHENGTKLPKAYIACGAKDFLYEDNIALKDKMIAYGYDTTWVEHPDFGHEWRFWDMQIEAFLDWLPRTDAYKDVRTGV